MMSDVAEFRPLSPSVLHILMVLAGGERHGYAIMQEVEELTDGTIVMGPGTLYTAIKRLVEQGLIAETDARPDPDVDDDRRRYYELTDAGRRLLAAETRRLEQLVRAARSRNVLSPGFGSA